MKPVNALHVMLQGSKVGELVDARGRGIYFSYDADWLANVSSTHWPTIVTITQNTSRSLARPQAGNWLRHMT